MQTNSQSEVPFANKLTISASPPRFHNQLKSKRQIIGKR